MDDVLGMMNMEIQTIFQLSAPKKSTVLARGKIACFVVDIWRPSQCPNEIHDSSLESVSSLFSKTTFIFLIRVFLHAQKNAFSQGY